MTVEFVEILWAGRHVRIEHEWIAAQRAGAPLLLFLHEGLGSRAMWKDFPRRLCDAAGCRGLVFSRPGYGRSTPRAADERWAPDFMHRQAFEVLPPLLRALQVPGPLWLFGHSDGGSIALLHAARHDVAGCIVLAPHVFVEDKAVENIEQARRAYLDGDLRQRLAKHHDDPDSAFWGWNGIWLDPAFRGWNIEADIEAVRCPVLAVQGMGDEYGTMEQIDRVQQRVPHAERLELADCGHSPHRDRPDLLIEASVAFIARHHNRENERPPSPHSLAAPQGGASVVRAEPSRPT